MKRGFGGSHGSNGPIWGARETQEVITSVRGLLVIMRVWEELEEVVRVIGGLLVVKKNCKEVQEVRRVWGGIIRGQKPGGL